MADLFDKLNFLIRKHGIEKVLTTLEDICFIRATNARLLKKNGDSAKRWEDMGDQVKKIKAK